MKVAGLMSGTSMDGVDTAILEVQWRSGPVGSPGPEGTGARPIQPGPGDLRWALLGFRHSSYSEAQREQIRSALTTGGAREICLLHAWLGEWMAGALLAALEAAGLEPDDLAAVGSHGQTLWHHPPRGTERGASLQVGDPATLAERSGIPVVADLRARDLAAGGHGAPLVPWADRIFYSHPARRRAIQNLGGMGNVTWLPAGGEAPGELGSDDVLAFDTGPGVALLDEAAERATGGRLRFDEEGRIAASGTVDTELLERLLAHPFFAEEPPRSTGREIFGEAMVREASAGLEPGREEEWRDLLATLTALTARSVADAYDRWLAPRGVDEVFLTGGGARNPALVRSIRDALAPLPVRSGDELSLPPHAREAAAFGLLAWAHLHGIPAGLPGATGTEGPRVLGTLTPGRSGRRGS